MIQLLTYTGREKEFEGKDVVINKLHDPQSFDEFKINIIDLRDDDIWKCNGNSKIIINCINDFKSLKAIIELKQKSNVIIIIPQNIEFQYFWSYTERGRKNFTKTCELKDMISEMTTYILKELNSSISRVKVFYENTRTKLNANELLASFSFHDISEENILTKSIMSNRPTTIKLNDIILTSLDFSTYIDLIEFLRHIKLIEEKEEIPEWLKELKMFDDEEQLNIIEDNISIIQKANGNIGKAKQCLDRNERFKSILYTSGDELVSVIFDILEEMLGWDLDSFEDKKNEDFSIEYGNNVFIGEIKGITTNVKNANVSQLDNHVQNYIDNNDVDPDSIVALLIINHQRNKPLIDREDINHQTINLSIRNGSLIIETVTLLKLFEKFLNKELTQADCIKLLVNSKGKLTLN